jgi:hypothetical protein
MNKKMVSVILTALVCMVMATHVVAQPSPFVITGYVFDSNSDPCNDPSVHITNTSTFEGWDADTSPTSNYYRLVITSDNVSANDLLQFDASGCSQSNTTQHTVTQEEINDGGLFAFNITLKSTIVSCNSSGSEKNEFAPGEIVYVRGSGLAANTGYKLWIQDDPVGEGDTLNASVDPSGSQELVTTNASGNLAITNIWNISSGTTPTHHHYDIVADNQVDGTTGACDVANDSIDSASTAGIVAPVPELPSIALFAVGLLTLSGLVRRERKD